MKTKNVLLCIERASFQSWIFRLPILLVDRLVRRLMWLWSRMRFGATVRNRGVGCICHWTVDLKYPENIKLGNSVIIGMNSSIGAHSSVRIGDYVRISRDVMIETASLDFSAMELPYQHISKPIVIERGVWLGARSLVLGGVTIGEGSVIAAGAVVSRNVPAGSIVAGVPARVIGFVRAGKQEPML